MRQPFCLYGAGLREYRYLIAEQTRRGSSSGSLLSNYASSFHIPICRRGKYKRTEDIECIFLEGNVII